MNFKCTMVDQMVCHQVQENEMTEQKHANCCSCDASLRFLKWKRSWELDFEVVILKAVPQKHCQEEVIQQDKLIEYVVNYVLFFLQLCQLS